MKTKAKERSPFRREMVVPTVRALTNDEAEVLLYDEIGGLWGIQADDIRRDLESLAAKTIHVRINSPGGSVFDGMAVYNTLREHDARIVTHIDGLAASMASVIAMAGDEVRMSESAFLMIHEPWTITIGNAEQLRKDAALLDKIGGTAVHIYQAKTGVDDEEVRAWMEAETWFTGQEAADAGFVDALDNAAEDDDPAAQVAALFDLSIFAHTPDALVARGSGTSREPTTRQLERALRDAGLSRSEAARMMAARDGLRDAATVPKASDLSTEPKYQEVLSQLRAYRKDIGNG